MLVARLRQRSILFKLNYVTALTKIEKIRIYCEGLKATYATDSIKLSKKVWMASLSIQSDAMRKKKSSKQKSNPILHKHKFIL